MLIGALDASLLSGAALVVAVIALVVALAARARASGVNKQIEDAQSEARRRVENAQTENEKHLDTLRRTLVKLARGEKLDDDMILEGRLWRETDAREAVAMVTAGNVRLLDVRTPQETAAGIIPGAVLIPIDQLEARVREIAKDKKPLLVYCAGGSRSAAACEFLSTQGHDDLLNLSGGFGAWNGPRAVPGR
jgi:rhodanese-related sulfurtransferase